MKRVAYHVRLVALVEIFDDADGQARHDVLDLTDPRTRMLSSSPRASSYLAPASEAERIATAFGTKYIRAMDPENGLV